MKTFFSFNELDSHGFFKQTKDSGQEMFDAESSINRPVLHYFGGKWRIAKWVLSYFPDHKTYVEPYGGGASILLRKKPSAHEVYNDLDSGIVNLFSVLRDDEKRQSLIQALQFTPFSKEEFGRAKTEDGDTDVESARKLLVRSFMGFSKIGVNESRQTGFIITKNNDCLRLADKWHNHSKMLDAVAKRLLGVILENRDALEILEKYDGWETLHYVDPPYLMSSRSISDREVYLHEMSESDHERLLTKLKQLEGHVVLSGYDSELYNDHLVGWRRHSRQAQLSTHRKSTEFLWIKPSPDGLKSYAQGAALDSDPKERIRAGAYRSHSVRVAKQEATIKKAIAKFKAGNRKIRRKEIAELVGMSPEQISRRYKHLFEKT